MEKYFSIDSHVYCGVMTTQYLDCMVLSINLLTKKGVEPDAALLGNLGQYFVLPFKIVMRHMVSTKASTDGVETINLLKNTQPNTTKFKNWCTTIE